MGRKGTGVEVRKKSIRIKFTPVSGQPAVKETLCTPGGDPLPPTAANEKRANSVADTIHRHIANGTWSDAVHAEFFPHSKRLQAAQLAPSSFGTLADLWLQSQGKKTPSTLDQYSTAVRFWKRMFGEATPVPAVTHKIVAARVGGYPWKTAKQHNNYMIALRGIMALEYRGSADNPVDGIENMPVVQKLPDPLSPGERDQVLAHLAKQYDPRVHAYYLWMFYTGMRPEETIALRWSDIDFNHETARVQRVRTFKGTERDGSKTHAERDVDLVPQAMAALAVMKPFTFMKRVERDGDEDTAADIFENPVTGKPWHDERSQRDHYWKPALRKLGVRARRSYCTRHTYCTVALMAGVPPAYIAAQAGHSVQMLLTTYAKWIPGSDDGRARRMLSAAMGANLSPSCPQDSADPSKSLISNDLFGRRDWTRTKA